MSIDDGALTIIFNGEIFNAAELRRELETSYSEKFRSSGSDTEVLIRLFKHFGIKCLERLNGMFSFAIYCRNSGKVTLARDYFGIKPLCYSVTKTGVFFASELRTLRDCCNVNEELNMEAISEYLDLGFISAPKTAYSGVKRLNVGCYAEIDIYTGAVYESRWKKNILKTPTQHHTDTNYLEKEIRQKFMEAVENWCISDEQIGFSLSGGLDSSSIVGAASTIYDQIDTYSVGYADQHLALWDETNVAQTIASELKTNHHEISIALDTFESDLTKITEIFSEPYGGGLPSYYLFKAAHQNRSKVMITGVGGDELFGNYNNHLRYLEAFPQNEDFRVRSYIDAVYLSCIKGSEYQALKSDYLNEIGLESNYNLIASLDQSESVLEQVHQFDINVQLPNEFLSMIDLLSMHFSVEARTPFLDKGLAELVLSLPIELRSTPEKYKSLLTNSLRGITPRAALNQNKSGFSLPLSVLLRETLSNKFKTIMSKKKLAETNFYGTEVYEKIIQPFEQGDNRFVALVWRIFMLQFWLNFGGLKN